VYDLGFTISYKLNMDINKKEKELFANWYKQAGNGTYAFPKFDDDSESFFTKHNNDNYLMEYDFDSLPELKEKLQNMWQGQECMEKIITPVLVAAMKNKPQKDVCEKQSEVKSGDMPTFIYNF